MVCTEDSVNTGREIQKARTIPSAPFDGLPGCPASNGKSVGLRLRSQLPDRPIARASGCHPDRLLPLAGTCALSNVGAGGDLFGPCPNGFRAVERKLWQPAQVPRPHWQEASDLAASRRTTGARKPVDHAAELPFQTENGQRAISLSPATCDLLRRRCETCGRTCEFGGPLTLG